MNLQTRLEQTRKRLPDATNEDIALAVYEAASTMRMRVTVEGQAFRRGDNTWQIESWAFASRDAI